MSIFPLSIDASITGLGSFPLGKTKIFVLSGANTYPDALGTTKDDYDYRRDGEEDVKRKEPRNDYVSKSESPTCNEENEKAGYVEMSVLGVLQKAWIMREKSVGLHKYK